MKMRNDALFETASDTWGTKIGFKRTRVSKTVNNCCIFLLQKQENAHVIPWNITLYSAKCLQSLNKILFVSIEFECYRRCVVVLVCIPRIARYESFDFKDPRGCLHSGEHFELFLARNVAHRLETLPSSALNNLISIFNNICIRKYLGFYEWEFCERFVILTAMTT